MKKKYFDGDTCKVSWCSNAPVSRYFCWYHYMYEYRNGEGSAESFVPKNLRPEIEDTFLDKVDEDVSTGCWNWVGRLDRDGYGCFSADNKDNRAHRYSILIFTGHPVPPGYPVHHTCSNRSCVNPDHLLIVSNHENYAEMLERSKYNKEISDLREEISMLESIVITIGIHV